MEIIKGVNNPNLRLCLDIGHVNAYSKISIMDWLKSLAPFISHFHIHNNDGSYDKHDSLTEGTIPIKQFLTLTDRLCPDATYTLELTGSSRPSVKWLASQDYFEDIR